MTNCLASSIVSGEPWQVALGIVAVLLAGAEAGFVNGAIVVYGRLQPIITTLATGAVYYGIALLLRPVPGGDVDPYLAAFLTNTVFETVPTSLLLLFAVVVLILLPFPNPVYGRGWTAG